MWIKNAQLLNQEGLSHLHLQEGQIRSISADFPAEGIAPEEILDAQGGLVIPPLVEPHIHLDTAMSATTPPFNEKGTLFEGIAVWKQKKAHLSIQDVKHRASLALDELFASGVQYIRTHVDITDPSLTALDALLEVKAEYQDRVELQIIAFPQEGIISFPQGKELLYRAIKKGVDGLGAIPHFEFQRDWGNESLRFILDLAKSHYLLVDVHCDEIDDEQSRFLEVLASEALIRQMGEKVCASHTTAMGSYNDAYTSRLMGLLQQSKIHFIANPMINLHLGGRYDLYPKRRGITRIRELQAAGCNVALGQDCLQDPWYPLGTGNPLDSLWMALHAEHLMDASTLQHHGIDFVTHNAARALSLPSYGLKVGNPAHLLIYTEKTHQDIVRKRPMPRYILRGGQRCILGKDPS